MNIDGSFRSPVRAQVDDHRQAKDGTLDFDNVRKRLLGPEPESEQYQHRILPVQQSRQKSRGTTCSPEMAGSERAVSSANQVGWCGPKNIRPYPMEGCSMPIVEAIPGADPMHGRYPHRHSTEPSCTCALRRQPQEPLLAATVSRQIVGASGRHGCDTQAYKQQLPDRPKLTNPRSTLVT